MFANDVFKEVYMSYTPEERAAIGEQIYKHELSKQDASAAGSDEATQDAGAAANDEDMPSIPNDDVNG